MAGNVVVDQIQIGNSGTSSNNFVLKTFDDGTAKLQRGVIGGALTDVLTIGTDGTISGVVAGEVNPASFSLGQTWQVVTRTSGVTYTNDTGKPIILKVSVNGTSTSSICSITIDGVNLGGFAAGQNSSGSVVGYGSIVIPAGATYVLTDSGVTSRASYELR